MNPMSTWDPSGKIYVGLGNPDAEYEHTYHNIGASAVQFLSGIARNGFAAPSKKHFSYVQTGTCVFALTDGYMNESGIAVRETLDYFGKESHELVVLHDDSDMKIGSFKFSYNQRSAGHHGIDSIIAQLGTSEFYRLKIGIRPNEEHGRKKAEEFVLKKTSQTDRELFRDEFAEIKKTLKL